MNTPQKLVTAGLMAVVISLLGSAALVGSASAADASAADGPQYGAIGQYGEAWRGGGFDAAAYDKGHYDKPLTPGKFIDPVGFAVDTSDGTPGGDGTAVYVLDRTSNLPAHAAGRITTWRLQKLSDRGAILGTDRFSLPADGNEYEMLGLAVDPAAGTVYALMVTFNPDVGEAVKEVLGWSTTADVAGRLAPGPGLPPDSLAKGVAGFAAPGVLSSSAQLSSAGEPVILQPEGLAVDATGGIEHLAVLGLDPSGQASTGIAQVCSSAACGAVKRGAISREWSATVLNGLPNDNGEAFLNPAGISTAADGSLTLLLDEATGPSPSNIDVVDVPANLISTPAILSSPVNAVTNADLSSPASDDAAVFTEDAPLEGADPDGATAATILAAPQVVALSNGLYAGEFEPDPTGQPDPQNPSVGPGLWTNHDPGVRLLAPETDGTLSAPAPPLTSLFDTLGNQVANTAGVTDAASACGLTDGTTAAAGDSASPFPSLQAGAGGALWVLTRGSDSAGGGSDARGGRELIELAPKAGDPCPTPSGTFSVASGSGAPQPASTITPLNVAAGATVKFDASTIAYMGGATAEYDWNFGDGDTLKTLGSSSPPFQWPDPTASETYTTAGTYTVTLTVFGDFGAYQETGTIQVGTGSVPKASVAFAPPNPDTATTVSFDGSGSTPSAGATIEDYLWEFGDGTIDDTTGPTDTHVYALPGPYTVRLRIHDSRNGLSAPATQSFTVTPAPPPPPEAAPGMAATATPLPLTGGGSGVKAPIVRVTFGSPASRRGMVAAVVWCPAGQTACAGTVALKTAKRVVLSLARSHGRHRTRRGVLALGAAKFTIAGGKHETIHIQLGSAGLALLRKVHSLRALATVSAANPQGRRSTRTVTTTLRYQGVTKTKRRRHR